MFLDSDGISYLNDGDDRYPLRKVVGGRRDNWPLGCHVPGLLHSLLKGVPFYKNLKSICWEQCDTWEIYCISYHWLKEKLKIDM